MSDTQPITFLCLASYYKGAAFMQEAKRLGCRVYLLTRERLAHEEWPMESIDERFLMPDLSTRPNIFHAVSYLMRERKIDRIIPLDDYDVETAAALREHLRLPGQGDTAVRFFRDKLAMRERAHAKGIRVPEFTSLFNYDRLREFMAGVPPPWVCKPRLQAGAIGIRKVNSVEEVWRFLEELGDEQSFYLLEKYVPGEVFHVDSIVSEKKVVFSIAHQYAQPPMNVSHEGGIFITRTLPRNSSDAKELASLNKKLLAALGMERGVNHAEYIKGNADGKFYFLECAARVGGANIAETVQFAAGLNLWGEWARVELADVRGEKYELPELKKEYAGILICLARQEWPDTSAYDDPEIVWRMRKKGHAGVIVASPDPNRVQQLLDRYAERFARDFLAVLPPLKRPEDEL